MPKAKAINKDRDLLINFYLLLATILLMGLSGINQTALMFPDAASISTFDMDD